MNLSAWSIRNPIPAAMLFVLLTLAGLLSFRAMKVQNFPDMDLPVVMVTASLPPFSKPGQNVDVTVSSIGDAKNLRGGTLLMTPLKGADGQVYAMAQGNVVIAGAGAQACDRGRAARR